MEKPDFNKFSFGNTKLIPMSLIVIIFFSFYGLFVKENNSTSKYALIPDLPEIYDPLIEGISIDGINNLNNKKVTTKNKLSGNNYTSANASLKISDYKEDSTITLKFTNPTWIQIRNNLDEIILSKLMDINDEFSYKMNLEYNITAGNAGNILVIIDNNTLGKIGKLGQVVDALLIYKNFFD